MFEPPVLYVSLLEDTIWVDTELGRYKEKRLDALAGDVFATLLFLILIIPFCFAVLDVPIIFIILLIINASSITLMTVNSDSIK